ncbi:hypothetical protein EYF80_046482 [Liparis tanakae]|uniref:Uncharacterized protein n=1 Tax=Liparis tanakae TaxID=230148 RepID=A0A4Z2FQ12_9TELE|nr:hypothetical protein EYF80_046482 [Liparis tanakae]
MANNTPAPGPMLDRGTQKIPKELWAAVNSPTPPGRRGTDNRAAVREDSIHQPVGSITSIAPPRPLVNPAT